MSKQVILDTYWLEFMDFWVALNKEAKAEELDKKPDMMDIFSMMTDDGMDKFKKTAVLLEFKEPNETTFWKWYGLIRPLTEVEPTKNKGDV